MSGSRIATVVLAVALVASTAVACGSSGPTAAPTPTSPGAAPTGPAGQPPDAALLVPDGDPVVGQLGGYVWRDAGSDSPWLPGTPVTVAPTRPLLFALSADVPVEGWTARYAPPGNAFPTGPVPLAAGSTQLEIVPPPSGTWTVSLRVTFGNGLGDATYYWHVRVE
jgi:hypothetical protein